MASKALVRAQEEIAKLRSRTASIRAKAERGGKTLQRDAVSVAGAYAFGAYKKSRTDAGQALPTVFGMDANLTVVAALWLASQFTEGSTAEISHDLALGIACGSAMAKGEGTAT